MLILWERYYYPKWRLEVSRSSSLVTTKLAWRATRASTIPITITKPGTVSIKARRATKSSKQFNTLINMPSEKNLRTRHRKKMIDIELPWTVTRWATHWPTRGFHRLLQGGRHNLWWEIQVSPKKLNPIISEVPVVVHPCKCLPYIFLWLKALHQLNHLQIWNINFGVFCKIVVLLCIANSLCTHAKYHI